MGQTVTGPNVRFQTNLGDIDVVLLPESAPVTVANFLKYVNRGVYEKSIIHRSVNNPRFVIQGGGFRWLDNRTQEIPNDGPIQNEFRISNTRGTMAMAKLGDNPNSATTQWFFNLVDNAATLDGQNGGFTVFARVADDASLAVMDEISRVRIFNGGSPFDQIPLVNYVGGTVREQNFVMVKAIVQRAITNVITAGGFGGAAFATAGSFIEIYGVGLGGDPGKEWTTGDFVNGAAPTTLGDVSVTVGGQAAYVSYVSANQINVQVPANAPLGDAIPVIVNHRGRETAPFNLAIKSVAGGLLAPARFKVGEKQYVVATRTNGSFVSNGSIEGIPAAPAVPGETLVLYGVGFGPVNPSSTPIAGQVVTGTPSMTTPIEVRIGDSVAQVGYAGLTPGLVGVYQFNITVPAGAPTGDLPLRMTVAGEAIPQTLFLPVSRP
jgi:uncharacterized protein (TIGR03437 family)